MICKIYIHSTAQIILDKPGAPFKIGRGVRQGDPLSPILFVCVLESIFKKLGWEDREPGIKIDGKFLSDLRFADDIVLFANTTEELIMMLEELNEQCQQAGLRLNINKTKIMSNSINSASVILNGEEIEAVDQYVYLGQTTSFKNKQEEELSRRIALAWAKYWSLKDILKGKYDNKMKKKVFDSRVLPTLTYGCQTWSLSKHQMNRLTVCQRRMERSMLGIKLKDRIPNKEIRRRTGLADVASKVKRLKWKWAGHIMRTKDDRWTKSTTLWVPRNKKRRRGRQFKR